MSRYVRVLEGMLSFAPLIFFVWALRQHLEDFPILPWLLICAVTIGFIVHMSSRVNITLRGKWLWFAALLLLWPIAIPVYWLIHMRGYGGV